MVTKANAGEVESSDVDVCERKGAPSPTGTTPALAKGTASIELAGGAEKATAAKPEALEPGHMVRKDAGAKRHRKAKGARRHKEARTRANAGLGNMAP